MEQNADDAYSATWIATPDGRKISATKRSDALMLWREIFEGDVYADAARLVPTGGIVLDIGANVGLSAMYFADRVERAQILAFEPAEMVHACLKRNLSLYAPTAQALRLALGERQEMRTLNYYPSSPSQSGFYSDPAADDLLTRMYLRNEGLDEDDIDYLVQDRRAGQQESVEQTTVSEVMRQAGLNHVDLVKIDVERAELDVLGGIDDGHWPHIGAVVVEVHDIRGRLEAVTNMLSAVGFTVTVRQEPWLATSELHTVLAQRG
jgi:FkbM family methyltransferase